MPTLPSHVGTIKSVKEREAHAFTQEHYWWNQLTEAYQYFLPQRNLYNIQNKGQKKMERIFDSTALTAIQQGASKLQENIAPIWTKWATFRPTDEIQALINSGQTDIDEEELRDALEKQSDIVFDYINRSNFHTQFYETALDILIGTGTLKIEETDDVDNPICFRAIPQIGIGFEEGPNGNIETHWRRFEVKANLLERMWVGFEPSENIRNIIKNSPQSEVTVSEGVIFDPRDNKYWGCVWVQSEDRFSWVEDFGPSSPWVTGRYSKVSGEIRGRGPAMQALPDVRSLNKAKEFVLQKAAIDLAGMYTATDDGVTNPYTIRISPGVVIPVGSNNSQNPSIQRLDTSANLQLAQFEIQDLQQAIKIALFNDVRDPTGPVRSATEIAVESRELAKRIGSAFGRLQTEVLVPVLKRVVHILTRRGMIEPIKIDGREIRVKFTSPLAKAQDGEDLLSVQQAVQFVLGTAGPEQVQMNYKIEDFGTWAAEKTGMPAELVRSQAEKQKVAQAGAQAAVAQAEQGGAPPPGPAIQPQQ